MDHRAVLFVLGNLLLVLGACLLAPLAVAIIYSNQDPGREILAFAVSAGVAMGLGLIGRLFFRSNTDRIRVREGFAIVTFSWMAVVFIGMLPYLISGVCDSVSNAFFETMSGFTTTGATIFPRVEVVPHGVQFWRCMTQWLGGMGIVVLSVALLPMLGAGGYRLLKAETPGGVAFERESPRITDTAKELWKLYLLLSVVEALLLRISGMSTFDSLCHTFTTMSTGGFSPHSESAAFFGPITQWIIIVFMLLAGINFSLHAQALRGRFRDLLGNAELRLYLGIILVCSIIGFAVVDAPAGVEQRVRDTVFQIVAVSTTTGFVTTDFDQWPQLMRALLVGLMFVGGCMGSTGGGIKVARVLIFAKTVGREMYRPIFPHAVRPIRIGDKVIEQSLVSNVLAFGCLFTATFTFGVLVMAASGYDLTTSISASASAVGNIGPGLGKVGPTQTWEHLPDVAKWLMGMLMLAGRLELYSVLILLTPWVWRR